LGSGGQARRAPAPYPSPRRRDRDCGHPTGDRGRHPRRACTRAGPLRAL